MIYMSQYITHSRQINLSSNSADVINGSKNSQMIFNIPTLLKKEKNILYNQISVTHAEIPISYYVVNDNNNHLETDVIICDLPKGNYDAYSFSEMFERVTGISLTLDIDTGKFTMVYSLYQFHIFPLSTCYKILGLKKGESYESSSSGVLTMIYPCNFLGINRIKIKSQMISTNNLDTGSGGHSSLLTTIPITDSLYSLVTYINFTGFKNIVHNQTLDSLDISLTDEDDNLIDFNGIDVFITLQIDSILTSLEKEETLNDVLEKLNSQPNI